MKPIYGRFVCLVCLNTDRSFLFLHGAVQFDGERSQKCWDIKLTYSFSTKTKTTIPIFTKIEPHYCCCSRAQGVSTQSRVSNYERDTSPRLTDLKDPGVGYTD